MIMDDKELETLRRDQHRSTFWKSSLLGAGAAAITVAIVLSSASGNVPAPPALAALAGTPVGCTAVYNDDGSVDIHCPPRPAPTDTPTASPTATPSPSDTPTVPPTTVPPTTPPATTTAPPVEVAGPRVPINAITTGFPAGTTLTAFSGQPASNTTYTGRSFSAGTVTASNVTFRNCSFSSGPIFTGDNVTVDHCTFTGGVSLSGGDNFVFTSNNVVNWHGDALHITSDSGPVNNVIVQKNWFHNPNASCNGDHVDGVQLLGVNHISISDNIIDLGPWVSCSQDAGDGPLNGAFQVENTQGADLNGTITHNWVNGGGYVARFYQCQTFSFTWNQFGPTSQFGPATVPAANRSCFVPGPWANNRNNAGALVALPTS